MQLHNDVNSYTTTIVKLASAHPLDFYDDLYDSNVYGPHTHIHRIILQTNETKETSFFSHEMESIII